MKILIASHNPAKITELSKFLNGLNFETCSLNDLDIHEDVEETGITFEENALLKARSYSKLADLPTLSDDGGIMIDALNGEPGVKSRRWKGYPLDDQELLDYTLERLLDVPTEKRTAHLVVVLALVFPDGQEFTSQSSINGIITEKQMIPISEGFPFRSIFFVPQFEKMLGELSHEEHEAINHRLKALQLLLTQFQ
jgi:XTP/dITP diphosphohydrolase